MSAGDLPHDSSSYWKDKKPIWNCGDDPDKGAAEAYTNWAKGVPEGFSPVFPPEGLTIKGRYRWGWQWLYELSDDKIWMCTEDCVWLRFEKGQLISPVVPLV
jgi:hypothetical protein